jgi:hypothetical protein
MVMNSLRAAGLDFDDGGLQAEQAGTGIDDEVNATVEFGEHGAGRGGTDGAETVGAGCSERFVESADDAAENGIGADADGDGGKSGGNDVGHDRLFRQQDRERTRPEALGHLFQRQCDLRWHIRHEIELIFAGQMNDERIKGGPLLGLEDFRDGGRIERVRCKAIDRFRWQGDDFAFTQQPHGLIDRLMHERRLVGGQNGGDVTHDGDVWLSITAQAL